MARGKLFIGTSGWVYPHWDGVFYPTELSLKDKLKYFAKHFKTAEVNYSFYHLPKPGVYQNWYNQTPRDFLFSVKASRFITHIKRLKGVRAVWKTFLKNTLNLKEKLGPILFQFPPSFKTTPENTKRLENFLKFVAKYKIQNTPALERSSVRDAARYKIQFVLEFRHKSWCDEKVYKLLRKYKAAWVIADSPRYPKTEVVTANFVYIRMHGSKILFSSKYTKKELKNLTQKIKKWLKRCDVYVYFNNDAYGYAIENAKELLRFCLP